MQLPERRRAIDREQWEVRRGEIVLERVNHEVGGGGRVQLTATVGLGRDAMDVPGAGGSSQSETAEVSMHRK